jgi:hypothetical protein
MAAQAPGRRARVVEQHAVAPLGLGPGPSTRQGLGMGTVPLAEQHDERAVKGAAHVDASQIVQAKRIARTAPCCGQHVRGHQGVVCWGHTQPRLRHDTGRLSRAPPQAMREAQLQVL